MTYSQGTHPQNLRYPLQTSRPGLDAYGRGTPKTPNTHRRPRLPIAFREVAQRANLRRLIEEDRGQPSNSRRNICPFHDDHSPDLAIDATANRWRCWACGAAGDAIDWLTEHRGMTTIEAAAFLGADVDRPANGPRTLSPGRPLAVEATPTVPIKPAWEDPDWQTTVDGIVNAAKDVLWSVKGRPALRWLRWRGLADRTIRMARLGYIATPFETEPLECIPPDDRGRPQGIYAARGVVFPYALPGSWYSQNEEPPGPRWAGANVRRLMLDPFEPLPKSGPNKVSKCLEFRRTERGHLYPHPDIEATQGELPALLVEGEIDALLGWQEVGHILHVGTVGGANGSPRPSAMEALDRCPVWLLGFDHDEAGALAVADWRKRSPVKCKRVLLPTKDLGEFVQSGGNVREWIATELARLGIDSALPRGRNVADEAPCRT